MTRFPRLAGVALVAAPILFSACKKREEAPPPPPPPAAQPAAVATVSVGKAIDNDKRIVAGADTIGRRDPMYVSVATTGNADNAMIEARWFAPDGVMIKAESTRVNLAGPAVTEFHLTRDRAWPVGRYKVDVLLNGQVAGSKEWEIR